ncbi:MAG: ABC transporter permease, partial [Clostridia bacterium]|nr:ABC transporter permease [Clostridia bacterium]
MDRFHKEASAIDDLTILTALNSHDIYLTEPKEWLEEDRNNGHYYLFADEAYRGVHTLYINSEYLDFFQVKLSEGAYFEKNDFLYEKDYVPVLLGENLRKYYSIGEEFEGQDYPCPKTRYKVVGFIAPNQYFTCPNSPVDVYTYDNYIVAPVIERELKDFFEEGSKYTKYLDFFNSRMLYCYYVVKPEAYETVRSRLEELLVETELDDLFTVRRQRVEKELASNFKDQLVISIAVCIATLLFSLFSFIFTMLYKIDDNIKNYAIRMVVGETYGGIAFRYLFESFTVFLLGQIT